MDQMTVRQKVGQLILLSFKGKKLDKETVAHMKQLSPGGVVFYRRNFSDASDIPTLIAEITDCIDASLPPFFCG